MFRDVEPMAEQLHRVFLWLWVKVWENFSWFQFIVDINQLNENFASEESENIEFLRGPLDIYNTIENFAIQSTYPSYD